MADDEFDDEDFEDEYEDGSSEDAEQDADPDFNDADFGEDDDAFDDDGGGGWGDGDEDMDVNEYIPIQKPDEDSDEFELDKDGNIVSPKSGLKRQKSADIQCWICSNCKSINKLSWTLTKFAMKCCICKQDTYAPTVKIFDSTEWEEPSNDFWECARCTLHNAVGSNDCEACAHPNEAYKQQSDDDEYGAGEFMKDEESEDDTPVQPMQHHPHMQQQHHGRQQHGMGGGGMHDLFGMMGMGGMGGMGGMRRGMVNMHQPRRKRAKDTRPFDKRKEHNLRNLLIIGFIRSCNAPHLPTKFFHFFNLYYAAFDRWDWNCFRGYWTSKKNDLVTIKRGTKDKSLWKNMYGMEHITYSERDKYPRKFEWKLRLLDRKQIGIHKDIDDVDMDDAKEAKKEAFEIQYMDVMVGVVNVDKLPNNQSLSKAFSMYSCGHGVFAGNGKIYKGSTKEWIKACKALKHEDCVTINIEWMSRNEFDALYPDIDKDKEKEKIKVNNKIKENELVAALTFHTNDDKRIVPKGAALCLPPYVPYKLAVASAKKRWEIEWISAKWISDMDDVNEKDMDIDSDDLKMIDPK